MVKANSAKERLFQFQYSPFAHSLAPLNDTQMPLKRHRPDPDGEHDDHAEVYDEGREEESVDNSVEDDDRKPPARETGGGVVRKMRKKRKRVISALQESKWQQMYQKLVSYKQKNGNCLVPNRYAEDPSLGAWGRCFVCF